ncbi:putative baseplate assembly protein [Haliangium sp.]|uniref:putative baseplate assembly protein n=1 Tax=Haliangium sp. TaxID=2663208 RepID=UPI003D138874
MSLPSPSLDDRSFDELLDHALAVMKRRCPDWQPSVHDPGTVLLELFAHLTEVMLYRLNRVPDKAHIELLRLCGITLQPPASAAVSLRFYLDQPAERDIEIPLGTRVTSSRPSAGAEPVVFVTDYPAVIAHDHSEVEVRAHACEWVEAELLGWGTGEPGLSLTVQRPPIIARVSGGEGAAAPLGATGDGLGNALDLVIAVETPSEALIDRPEARRVVTGAGPGGGADKSFRVWTEVAGFARSRPDDVHYVVDRMAGTITFAPAVRVRNQSGPATDAATGALGETAAALAAIPSEGAEIRAWYRRGGGPDGNVAAGTLDTLKDPIPGVRVTNPAPATGGAAAETLDNARRRAPIELHALRRAVTARDYESLARRPGVARTRAFTQSQRWAHAEPGTVEIRLVPDIPDRVSGVAVRGDDLAAHQGEHQRAEIQALLDAHRPLGTRCVVDWARYKAVSIEAHLVAHRTADKDGIRRRVLARLHDTVTPLPSPLRSDGWPFGQALYASDVYNILLSEPGVHHIDGNVRLIVDHAPEMVRALCRDPNQPGTYYAGSGDTLFRSTNGGDSWEAAARFPGEQVERIAAHPSHAGLVAVSTERVAAGADEDDQGDEGDERGPVVHRVHLSYDCGEHWPEGPGMTDTFDMAIHDLAFVQRERAAVLLLATDSGLIERSVPTRLAPEVTRAFVAVDPQRSPGFRAVATIPGAAGRDDIVVLAALRAGGVYRSLDGGRRFEHLGLEDYVHSLGLQQQGTRTDLWAGLAVTSSRQGCLRLEGVDAPTPTSNWQHMGQDWRGGTCHSLACFGAWIVAGTYDGGVLWLDSRAQAPKWQPQALGVLAGPGGKARHVFQVTVSGDGDTVTAMVGFDGGVARSHDRGYELCSQQVFENRVIVPPEWLLCTGEHAITVSYGDSERGG